MISGKIPTAAKLKATVVAAGPAGKSAYRYAVEGGYSGTEEQFYRDLSGTGSGVAGILYVKSFSASAFQKSGLQYSCLIPASEHGLGLRAMVTEVLREADAGYGNVWYQYKILPNGDVALYSAEPFDGKIVIEKI
ncbi:hypothetical protein [Anaerotruncus rubiinfantis]|jgi:hypothetical protein|uniref:hypothetical protein n=1 Tax=Anaerotruncus rubiinfantis TaxID=1720200 RepID=UPI0018980EA5|nr:hypothetical protein [Anaerotruncus rubiinfantis]